MRRFGLTAAVAALGAVLVVGGYLLVRRSSGLTITPQASTLVSAGDPAAAIQNANSPSIAVDPLQTDHLVAAIRIDRPTFDCAVFASADRGRTWKRGGLLVPEGATGCYAPSIAFAESGDAYLVFLGLGPEAGSTTGTYLARSTDGGDSFAPPVRVGGANSLQPRLVVHHKRVTVAWLDAGPAAQRPVLGLSTDRDNPLMAATSDDGGASFHQPVRVNPPGRRLVTSASLAMLGDQLLVAYYDLQLDFADYTAQGQATYGGPVRVVLAGSEDGGKSFHDISVPGPDVREVGILPIYLAPSPALAVDEPSGTVLVAWQDGAAKGGEVLLRRSSDRGHTWHDPTRVDSGAGTARRLPALGVAPGGRVDCVYYVVDDTLKPPAATVAYAVSADGGASFQPEVDLLGRTFDPDEGPIEPRSHRGDLGDRLSVVSLADRAVIGWAQAQSSSVPRQDVYTLVIDVHRRGFAL